MKNYFHLIYKILKIIDKNKKEDNFKICFEIRKNLKLTDEELDNILRDMFEENLIKGVVFHKYGFSFYNPTITIKGYQYLKENNIFRKIYNILKEIKEW